MSTTSDTPRCDRSRVTWDRGSQAGMAYTDGQAIERELNAALARVKELETELIRRHAEYAKALNKRVDVENELARAGAGKRELPTRNECREWALKLGNS